MLDPPVEVPPCPDELLLPLLVLGPNVKLLALLLPSLLVLGPNVKLLAPPLLLPPPNTLSQQLSTSALEGLLPDIALTHLMNLLFEPVLVLLSPVVDVPFLVLLEPVGSELLFTANAEVTILLLDAVITDTAVTIAIIANDVVMTFFLYIELLTLWLFIKQIA